MKITVYSAIFGDYDHFRPPLNASEDADYVLFTDKPVQVPVWDVRVVDRPYSRRKSARHYKILSHRYFPFSDYTIWIDGWLQLIVNPESILHYLGDNDIAMETHAKRDCVYNEAQVVINARKVIKPIYAMNQVNKYRAWGFPEHYGLTASFLVIRRNTERLAELEEMWWEELDRHTLRDQLSFMPCMWHLGMKCSRIPHGQGKIYRSFPHARSY